MAERLARTLSCLEADELAPAFVLGALDDDEMDAVRHHLADCTNEHAEFASLGSVVPALLETVEPVEPRPELGALIMTAAREERASRIEAAWRPTPQSAAADAVVADVSSARRRTRMAWVALAAAAAIVLAALGIWNLALRSQVDELAGYRNAVLGVLDRAASPGGQLAILTAEGAPNGPAGIAGVGSDGSVALAMRNLTPTTGTEVYEVWAIGGDGQPRPIGSFTVGDSGAGGAVTAAGLNEPGVTVAVTREPQLGATTPTLPIIALGTAQPAGS